MPTEWIVSACLGLGLAASCGFRVFIPFLVAAIAGKIGIIPLTENFHWLGSWPAIICFGTATVFEILAYYIPFFDNVLDLVTTPLAILGGTLLMTSLLPVDNNLLKWVGGLIVGGGSAGIIQSGTALLRLASTKTTAGIANPIVSTGEHAAAFGTSILALFIPIIVAVLIASLIFYLLYRLIAKK